MSDDKKEANKITVGEAFRVAGGLAGIGVGVKVATPIALSVSAAVPVVGPLIGLGMIIVAPTAGFIAGYVAPGYIIGQSIKPK